MILTRDNSFWVCSHWPNVFIHVVVITILDSWCVSTPKCLSFTFILCISGHLKYTVGWPLLCLMKIPMKHAPNQIQLPLISYSNRTSHHFRINHFLLIYVNIHVHVHIHFLPVHVIIHVCHITGHTLFTIRTHTPSYYTVHVHIHVHMNPYYYTVHVHIHVHMNPTIIQYMCVAYTITKLCCMTRCSCTSQLSQSDNGTPRVAMNTHVMYMYM